MSRDEIEAGAIILRGFLGESDVAAGSCFEVVFARARNEAA